MSNAVHHGAPGAAIEIGVSGAADTVTISVRNLGEAIPPTQIGRIFDAMKELRSPSGKDRRHLGLGLYIVDKIVRGHGGTIQVESDHRATIFRVHLPRVARRGQPRAEP